MTSGIPTGRTAARVLPLVMRSTLPCPQVWIDKNTDSQLLLVQCAGRALRAQPGKRATIYRANEETAELLRSTLQRSDRPPLALVG